MNTNLIHNILNFAIAIIAGLQGFDFTAVMSGGTAGKVIAALAGLKLFINAIRDGFAGMAKPQPPVV